MATVRPRVILISKSAKASSEIPIDVTEFEKMYIKIPGENGDIGKTYEVKRPEGAQYMSLPTINANGDIAVTWTGHGIEPTEVILAEVFLLQPVTGV